MRTNSRLRNATAACLLRKALPSRLGLLALLVACWVGASASEPFHSSPARIPGRIEAEDFDRGGDVVGYHDTDAANQGGGYRPEEGVDIEPCTDTGGGFNVGWTAGTEWMNYTVEVLYPGDYQFWARLASASAGGSFHLEVDGINVTRSLSVGGTGGWQNWVTVVSSHFSLTVGRHTLRFVWEASSGANLNWFELRQLGVPLTPAITWTPERLDSEQALGPAQLNARANIEGTFSYSPPAGTVLTAGRHRLEVTFTPGEKDREDYYPATASAEVEVYQAPPGPFGGTPWPVPGRIEAEHFDLGGIGSGYYYNPVDVPGFPPHAYRPGATVPMYSHVGDGGRYGVELASAVPPEWLRFSVRVASAGTYVLSCRAMAPTHPEPVGLKARLIRADGTLVGEEAVGPTRALPADWEILGGHPNGPAFVLAPGGYVVELSSLEGFALVDWIQFDQVRPEPFGGTPRSIPGRIEAEDFDKGGDGVGYHDTDAANQGGAYRMDEGVDIEPCTDTGGGFNVGWTAGTEWMSYTVDVLHPGAYEFRARLASASEGGSFHLEVDDLNVTGSLSVGGTGGGQNWVTVGNWHLTLSPGRHTLRFAWEASAGANLNWFEWRQVGVPLTPAITWTPERLDSEQALGPAQLNARANIDGTFSYSPPAGTVLDVGRHRLEVTFTPGEQERAAYGAATASAEVEVYQAPPGPFGGTPWPVPGRIEAEHFDLGGNGSGYYYNPVDVPDFPPHAYRPGAKAPIHSIPESGGGHGVDLFHNPSVAPEWLRFSVHVAAAGTYLFSCRATAINLPHPVGLKARLLRPDATQVGEGAVRSTSSEVEHWEILGGDPNGPAFVLAPGDYVVELSPIDGFALVDWIRFERQRDPEPFGGTPRSIPGRIEAEDFDEGGQGVGYSDADSSNIPGVYRLGDGVDVEACSDAGGGFDVGWTATGEWTAYTVHAPKAGSFRFAARVASEERDGSFRVEVDGKDVTGPWTVSGTGGWQNWKTVVKNGVTLSAGRHQVRFVWDRSTGFNLNWFEFTEEKPPGPFGGVARMIPGRIEAEDFDEGGANVGYIDMDPTNTGGQYRPEEGVDIETCTDLGGGYDVGWNQFGETLYYTVNVSKTGYYRIKARVASVAPSNLLLVDADNSAPRAWVAFPSTGGYQVWTDAESEDPATGVFLEAGIRRISVGWELPSEGGANLNWLEFVEVNAPPRTQPLITWPAPERIPGNTVLGPAQLNAVANAPGTFTYAPPAGTVLPPGTHTLTATFTPSDPEQYLGATKSVTIEVSPQARGPFGGSPHPVPGRIRAERYDEGGEGIAYHDREAANLGGSARLAEGVDLEPCSDEGGGANLSWTETGEWLEYTVDVARAASYAVRARVASELTGGEFSVRVAAADGGGPSGEWRVSVPVTGGWQVWTHVAASEQSGALALPAGRQVVRLAWKSSSGTANVNWLEILEVPVIAWNPAPLTAGTALGSAQFNATSDSAGTYSYDLFQGNLNQAGTATLRLKFTPTDPSRYAERVVYSPVEVTPPGPRQVQIAWANPAPVLYGTVLGPDQLNASADAPGAFAYTPAAGTVPAAGSRTLTVTFTPHDPTTHATATASVILSVTPAPLNIRADDKSMTVGGSVPALTASYAGFVNGEGPGVLTSAPQLGTTATPASPAGNYPISVSGAAAANYDIRYQAGTLAVTEDTTPVAIAQEVTTSVNRPVRIVLEGRATSGGSLRYTLASPPAHGRLSGVPPQVLYVPADHYTGEDRFAFKVGSGSAESAPATVVIRIGGTEPRVSGTALDFDGVNDVVHVDAGIPLSNQSMTLEAWVRPTTKGVNNFFMAQGNGGPNVTLHIGFMPTGVLRFGFGNNDLDTPIPYDEMEWHHWAFVYSTNGRTKRIYRDGILVATGTGTQNYGGSGRFTIGATPQLPSYFRGQLDEVRVWRIARTAEEIAAGSRRQVTGLEPGLLGYWRFDEGSGLVAKRTGNASGTPQGTLQGGVGWVESGVRLGVAPPLVSAFAAGNSGRGMRFRFPGWVGVGYQVEASSDLVNWEVVGATDPGADGHQEFEDTESMPDGQRYYRIRVP